MYARTSVILAIGVLGLPQTAAVQPPPVQASEIACGPRVVFAPPARDLRLQASPEHVGRRLFGRGDVVTLDHGAEAGLSVGQLYVARRTIHPQEALPAPGTTVLFLHTSGWLRVTAVTTGTATAVVEYACEGLLVGDYLETFHLPVVPDLEPAGGVPHFESGGHVLFGPLARRAAAVNELIVVDRGSDHGIESGQRFLIVRGDGEPPMHVGQAAVVEVRPDSSMLRILAARDAVFSGDRVAPLRQAR